MIKIIFLTVLTWSDPNFAADSLRLETINGKTFIIHQVGDHETLYRISKRYGAPITSILEFNPNADAGLEIGQILKVPYTPKGKTSASAPAASTMHKVQPKETLYSISRLYNVSPDDIKTWNNLKESSLSQGQELIIKKKSGNTTSTATAAVTSADKHTVETKETLYSIARKYNVSVQQLKDWNSLQGNDVKPGDILIVKNDKNDGSRSTETKVAVTEKPVVTERPPVVVERPTGTETKPIVTIERPVGNESKPDATEVKQSLPKDNSITISEGVRGSDEVKEGGLAELIEGTEGNRKYLALHRTAKTGTIMKVRNELNNREVFVRVVGPIPDTGVNDKIVIKISKSAYDRLGAIDPRFRAEVTYYK